MTQLARFQKRIHDMIPLSEALGVELVSYDGHALLSVLRWHPTITIRGRVSGGVSTRLQ